MSVLTSLDAAAAEDTLGCISYESGSQLVVVCLRVNALECAFSCACYISNVQEFALAVLIALLAVHVVVGEQKLYAVSSCGCSCRRGDLDLHTVGNGINAACNKTSCTGCLYETYTAGSLVALTVVECTE